jgi:hypothetical protein
MVSSPREIVKEFIFHVDGLEESLKSRIMRDLEPIANMGAYSWDISHLWGGYSPSSRHAKTYEDAESSMMAYAMSFSVKNGVTKNKYF